MMTANLVRMFEGEVPKRASELRLFSVMRNEAQRLPFFLKYYSSRGVDRFFIVDNDSTDSTLQILLSAPNVHVFRTTQSYSESHCGMDWLTSLLDSYGKDQWCVVADADEFLVYPGWESVSIPQLCSFLETEGSSALHCILVDMYSDKPFDEAKYVAGMDPLKVCPFFESESILCMASLVQENAGQWAHSGGVRLRLFELNVILDKISLIKYTPRLKLMQGMHGIHFARLSRVRGAVLHFKYLSDFSGRVTVESARGEHWNGGFEYKRYADVVRKTESICAYGAMSKRFTTSEDFIKCGIMLRPREYSDFFASLPRNLDLVLS